MSKQRLCVAMCTYNGAAYLQAQLDSIASQTRLPDELVVCDDRSQDDTTAIIQAFAAKVPFPVRLSTNEAKLGTTKNFEKAISLCAGDIIALADQDDVWHVEKLMHLETVFNQSPQVGAVFTDAQVVDERLNPLGHTLWESIAFNRDEQRRLAGGEALQVLLKHQVVTGATLAFHARFRELILPIEGDRLHDQWIALLISTVADLALIDRPLIQYRQHSGQQVGAGDGAQALGDEVTTALHTARHLYDREIRYYQQVYERLTERSRPEFPVRKAALSLIQQRIRHRQARAALPPSKLLRVPVVLREMASLRYWHHSNGFKSVIKDLLV